MDGTENPIPRKRKKGVRKEDSYKWSTIKKAKLEGKAYKNSVGNLVPPRKTGSDCVCSAKCTEPFPDEEKKSQIKTKPVFRHRSRTGCFLRNIFFKYAVNERKECKKAFSSLFGVTDRKVHRLCSLLLEEKFPKDKRRKQDNRYRMSEAECQNIYSHIDNNFPKNQTRYANYDVHYLDVKLTVEIMYDLFKEKFPDTENAWEDEKWWRQLTSQTTRDGGQPTLRRMWYLKKLKDQEYREGARAV
ncbi:hypothetical protein ABEB36_009224 [Hypothenemus hampei]|uniref:Uncharacterized protein n=1 Tax=Hypothenemus hampei TaxID=57062 RepID=A0ABD1ERQ2_HYPHA